MNAEAFRLSAALVGILLLVLLVARFKWHPFLALMFVSWGLAVTCGIDPVQAIAGFSKGFGDILSFVGIVILKGWIDKETMQRVRAIPNPLEKKIELTRVLGFPERVFTDPKGNHPGN